jgi:hypothetical protein
VSPLGQAHVPPWHVSPAAQAFPQLPQLLGSVWRFTQSLLLQQLLGGPHDWPPQPPEHMPALHVSPAAHTAPQPPQLLGSVFVSTQIPPQSSSPLAGHVHWQFFAGSGTAPGGQLTPAQTHIPLLHASSGRQAIPHVPQLLGSVWRLTHWSLQQVFGGPQAWPPQLLQRPDTQVAFAGHAWPQLPQLAGSLW